jgi:hypothetical protein
MIPDIDDFAVTLLEEAKRFFEKSKLAKDDPGANANRHAALMLGFCALEAHVNAVCAEMKDLKGIDLQGRALMSEADIKLIGGRFVLHGKKLCRLEDRVEFLCRQFGGKPLDRDAKWPDALAGAVSLRNDLTHPKDVPAITSGAVTAALNAILETINAIYLAVYKRPFPALNRGLGSRLEF